MRRRFFLMMSLALAACAGTGQQARARRFKGVWEFHFETSSFVAEDGAGPYWLSAEGEPWERLIAPFGETGRPWGRAAIDVEGELSEPGRYGHLGAYSRELRVTRVLSARLVERDQITRDATPHGNN
jgi:hypothetical protein